MPTRTPSTDAALNVAGLKERIEAGKHVIVIDVRNPIAFAASKIDPSDNVHVFNAPFSHIASMEGAANFADAIKSYTERHLTDKLTPGATVVAVCATGRSSVPVTEGLRRIGYDAYNLEGGMAAWNNHYDIRGVSLDDGTTIYQLSRPARGCLSYIVASGDEAVVIDPLRHDTVYADIARDLDLRIVRVLDTHGHADHISGGPALAKALDVPYNLHPYDAIHPIDVLPATIAYEPIHEGQRFHFGPERGGRPGAVLRTMHVPGHTLGSVAFILNESHAFVGDTIFVDSIARPDLGGRGDVWAPIHYESLKALMNLPDETVFWPGHFSSPVEADGDGLFARTVEQLRKTNGGVQKLQDGRDEFVRFILSRLPEFPEQYVDMKRVNIGLLQPSDNEAAMMETGRNICALSEAQDE